MGGVSGGVASEYDFLRGTQQPVSSGFVWDRIESRDGERREEREERREKHLLASCNLGTETDFPSARKRGKGSAAFIEQTNRLQMQILLTQIKAYV
jgi:hypothetical protein